MDVERLNERGERFLDRLFYRLAWAAFILLVLNVVTQAHMYRERKHKEAIWTETERGITPGSLRTGNSR